MTRNFEIGWRGRVGIKREFSHAGRGSLFWAGARRQSAKRIHWGRFAEMMDRLAYGKAQPKD